MPGIMPFSSAKISPFAVVITMGSGNRWMSVNQLLSLTTWEVAPVSTMHPLCDSPPVVSTGIANVIEVGFTIVDDVAVSTTLASAVSLGRLVLQYFAIWPSLPQI